jgi:beta-fructofuranosidase
MPLALAESWIWDFWLVADAGAVHVFFLKAPRSLGNPQLRHWHATIGHAVSTDLVRWDLLPDALGPGEPGAWDDLAVWTGSVIRDERCWHMLYTGTRRSEQGAVQRIGRATSDDLTDWRRRDGGPVLEVDRRWYESLDLRLWHDQAWRDPWLTRDPDGDFHAYVTARSANGGEPGERGVVGHARSPDLLEWQVLPPVTEPMGFGQMEVPQVLSVADRFYLVFSSDAGTQHPRRRPALSGTGTYYLVGDSPLGPFRPETLGVLEADDAGTSYAGKLFDLDGELVFLAWANIHPEAGFAGHLNDPRPVAVAADGRLSVGGAR